MISLDAIQDAILAVEASPLAREIGAGLVEGYLAHYAERDAARYRVLESERVWSLWADDFTLLVGAKDAEFEDANGPLILELKSKKEGRRTKAGEWYKGEGPQDWLQTISTGHQTGVYALHELEESGAPSIRVMVRAAVKSTPPEYWPPKEEDGIFTFTREYCALLKNAFRVRAAEIRAARSLGIVPWDWTGYKCGRVFGEQCRFWEDCSRHIHPEGRLQVFSSTDPGRAAIKDALATKGMDEWEPRLVILSASAYGDYGICREYGRRIQDGHAGNDESMALMIGSVFHAGCNAYHQSLIAARDVS